MPDLSAIRHVVVLMLENRSFDCMLGRLYPSGPGFDGLTGAEANILSSTGERIPVWNDPNLVPGMMTMPSPDPGELFDDVNIQIFGAGNTPDLAPPPMAGFVDDYMRQTKAPPYDPKSVMHGFTPEQVPVMSTLARAFAVSDQWHASAPNQTWPNRFFAHCATAGGYVNNAPAHFPYMMHTIFERFAEAGIADGWKIYFHDVPQALTLARLWFHRDGFCPMAQFLADAKAGQLPCYSFVEPRYFADAGLNMPNDQHPPHDVVFGEQLIAQVYNAVRASPCWNDTMLIVTYDEHGGCYDHAPPPLAVPPGDHRPHEDFAFDRYGVRVPALIISRYTKAGTVLRSAPAGMPHRGPPYPFDHTSIIATLRRCFGLGGPLTARDAAAPDLSGALNLPDGETNDGPAAITMPPYTPSPQDLQDAIGKPLSDMQASLHDLAAVLPGAATDIEAHIAALAAGKVLGAVEQEAHTIAQRLERFFGAKTG